MTPEERDLIAGLFERMRNMGPLDKDREADDLIARSVREVPDAAYMLVQSVLVQELALQEAAAKVEELERRLREEGRGQERPAAVSGSLLGGVLGRGRDPTRGGGSVPSIGTRAGAPTQEPQRAEGGGAQQRSDTYGQQEAQRGGGGGFLRSAMATAAGVAGGMLLADSIRGMLGSDGKAHAASDDAKSQSDTTRQDQQQEPQYQDPDDNDPGNTDAAWDGDFGSDDLDI